MEIALDYDDTCHYWYFFQVEQNSPLNLSHWAIRWTSTASSHQKTAQWCFLAFASTFLVVPCCMRKKSLPVVLFCPQKVVKTHQAYWYDVLSSSCFIENRARRKPTFSWVHSLLKPYMYLDFCMLYIYIYMLELVCGSPWNAQHSFW